MVGACYSAHGGAISPGMPHWHPDGNPDALVHVYASDWIVTDHKGRQHLMSDRIFKERYVLVEVRATDD